MDILVTIITLVGFLLTVFIAGISVGRLIEKLERHIDEFEDDDHNKSQKNNRR